MESNKIWKAHRQRQWDREWASSEDIVRERVQGFIVAVQGDFDHIYSNYIYFEKVVQFHAIVPLTFE